MDDDPRCIGQHLPMRSRVALQRQSLRLVWQIMICEHGAAAPRYCAICRHQGIMGKEQGITIAKESQLNWHNEAVICIQQMARTGRPFTAEDVVAEIGAPTGSGKVIGAAFNTVARSGMIWRCGERPADRKSSHRRMLAVWRGGQVIEQTRLFDE
jgi:hypothetical protein